MMMTMHLIPTPTTSDNHYYHHHHHHHKGRRRHEQHPTSSSSSSSSHQHPHGPKKESDSSSFSPSFLFEKKKMEETFLLVKCQEKQWKIVEQYCRFWISQLQTTTNSNSSPNYNDIDNAATAIAIRRRLECCDSWGNTPLHMACYFQPPSFVIRGLLNLAMAISTSSVVENNKSSSSSSSFFWLLGRCNTSGATPLLIACRSGACRPVLRLLLGLQQQHQQQLPQYIGGGGATVTMADDQGCTPFSALLQRYEMLQKIPIFKQQCKPLDQITKSDIMSLLSFEKNHYDNNNNGDNNDHPQQTINSIENGDSTQSELLLFNNSPPFLIVDTSNHPIDTFPLFWNTIQDLIQAAWYHYHYVGMSLSTSTSSSSLPLLPFSMLHGAALVAKALPIQLMDLIFRVYSREGIQFQHQYPNLFPVPLHLAITGTNVSKPQLQPPEKQQHATMIHQQSYFIQKILQLDPISAKTCMMVSSINDDDNYQTSSSNNNNNNKKILVQRSPFLHAIAMGLPWNKAVAHQHHRHHHHNDEEEDFTPTTGSSTMGPLWTLFQCHPDVLLERDVSITGLYPFQLAATISTTTTTTTTTTTASTSKNSMSRQKENHNNNDLRQLDTIYNLLRMSPESIRSHS